MVRSQCELGRVTDAHKVDVVIVLEHTLGSTGTFSWRHGGLVRRVIEFVVSNRGACEKCVRSEVLFAIVDAPALTTVL
jgi:hypothetical protein